MSEVRTLMIRIPVAYVAAQVLTGIEVGILAAVLVLVAEWGLPAALAAVFPLGIPLVSLQMAGVIALLGRSSEAV